MRRMLLIISVAALTVVALTVSVPFAFAKPDPDKEACKEGEFANFAFKNQGQCVSAVNQGFDPTPLPPPPPPPEGPTCDPVTFDGLSGFLCTFPGDPNEFFCMTEPVSGPPPSDCTAILF